MIILVRCRVDHQRTTVIEALSEGEGRVAVREDGLILRPTLRATLILLQEGLEILVGDLATR